MAYTTCDLCNGTRLIAGNGANFPCPACEMLIQESRVSLVAVHRHVEDGNEGHGNVILGLKASIAAELAQQIMEKGFVDFDVSKDPAVGGVRVKATAGFVRPQDIAANEMKRAFKKKVSLRKSRKRMIDAIERCGNPKLDRIVRTMSKKEARRIVDRFLLRDV